MILGEISAALEKKSGGNRKSENQKSIERTFETGKTATLSSVGISPGNGQTKPKNLQSWNSA